MSIQDVVASRLNVHISNFRHRRPFRFDSAPDNPHVSMESCVTGIEEIGSVIADEKTIVLSMAANPDPTGRNRYLILTAGTEAGPDVFTATLIVEAHTLSVLLEGETRANKGYAIPGRIELL